MKSGKRQKQLSKLIVNGSLLLIIIIWTIPTLGVFVSSFRQRDDIATSGWWRVFPYREWQAVREINPNEAGLDPNGVMVIEGVSGTFEDFRAGVATSDGKQITWIGNKRIGKIEVQEQVWTVNWNFTLDNYQQVLGGQDFKFTKPDGTVQVVPGDNMSGAFMNSLAVAIPSTVIPILIAAFARLCFCLDEISGKACHVYSGGCAIGCAIANCIGANIARLQSSAI